MWFRLCVIGYCLLIFGNTAYAAVPCERLLSHPDAWIAAKADALVRAARGAFEDDTKRPGYERVLDAISNTVSRCKLSENEAFVNRYQAFVEYVEAASLDRKPGHELGFIVPDKQYFDETRSLVQIPEFLLDPAFLRSVSRYDTLRRAKSFLRALNEGRDPSDQLVFFSYKSRHLGTPDNADSFRRLLIVVPGDREKGIPEKWVQFGITDPGARTRIRNLSVVSAVVGDDGTFNTYFKDYYRTYRRDGSISIKGRWELGYGDDNCAQCHKSGVLPIFPVAGSVSPDEQDAVRAVNERFRGYGSPRFGNYLDAGRLGPGLSFASPEDRIERFGERFAGTAVAHAMSCNRCHKPENLGYLNWPMDQVIIDSYITGGQMPRGHALPASESEELYKRLIQEYFATDAAHPGILKSWLLGKPL